MLPTNNMSKKLLASFVLVIMMLPGCAGAGAGNSGTGAASSAGTTDTAPADTLPGEDSRQVPSRNGNASVDTASDESTPGLQAARSTTAPKKSTPGKKPLSNSTEPGTTAEPPSSGQALTPSAKMIASAGRNPSAPQPEVGFILSVPDSIGDGEAFQLEFGAEGAQKAQIAWRGKNLTLGPCQGEGQDGVCRALLPVPLDEKAKTLPLSLTVSWAGGKSERFKADLPVKKRKYPVQRLKVDQKYVSPPAEMQEKIKQDRAELNAAISKVSPTRYWRLPFLRPVPGEVTSLYGMRRVFNGQPKSPHKGVDFDAKTGDPVAALEDGIVVLVSSHYYSGNIVIVDHGLGVFSSYIHLSGFNVSKEQKVARGDTIGFIGSTGRVTGPHLHLSLFVLGVGVNAAACIDM